MSRNCVCARACVWYQAKIAQLPLPNSCLDTIWSEVDAHFRLGRLMAQLEDIICVIGGMSGWDDRRRGRHRHAAVAVGTPAAQEEEGDSGGIGGRRLKTFALETLLLSPVRQLASATMGKLASAIIFPWWHFPFLLSWAWPPSIHCLLQTA